MGRSSRLGRNAGDHRGGRSRSVRDVSAAEHHSKCCARCSRSCWPCLADHVCDRQRAGSTGRSAGRARLLRACPLDPPRGSGGTRRPRSAGSGRHRIRSHHPRPVTITERSSARRDHDASEALIFCEGVQPRDDRSTPCPENADLGMHRAVSLLLFVVARRTASTLCQKKVAVRGDRTCLGTDRKGALCVRPAFGRLAAYASPDCEIDAVTEVSGVHVRRR